MAKFFGKVAYANPVTTPGSGVWTDEFILQEYMGDVVRNSRQLASEEKLNDDITVGVSISILADQYAIDHFFDIKYVEWAGRYWTVTDVDVQPPRLILRLGGLYHGTP